MQAALAQGWLSSIIFSLALFSRWVGRDVRHTRTGHCCFSRAPLLHPDLSKLACGASTCCRKLCPVPAVTMRVMMASAAHRVAVDGKAMGKRGQAMSKANSSAAGQRTAQACSLAISLVTTMDACHRAVGLSDASILPHISRERRAQQSASRRLHLGQGTGMMDSRDQRWFQSRRSSPNYSSPRAMV